MIAFFTYFASHWTLVIACVLGVAGLGAAAFFLKNWKIAVVAVGVAIAGFLYQGAVTDGIKTQMAKDAKERIAFLQEFIDAGNRANEADAKRALEDQKTIEQLQEQVSATPKNDSSCLDAGAAGRLRNIR
jgi:Tfp pilus assembly protein PilN